MRYISKETEFHICKLFLETDFFTQPPYIHYNTRNQGQSQQKQDNVQDPCPTCFPESRFHMNMQYLDIIRPYSVAVVRFHFQIKISCRQIYKAYRTVLSDIRPFITQILYPISIFQISRLGKIECSKRNRNVTFIGFQCQRIVYQ